MKSFGFNGFLLYSTAKGWQGNFSRFLPVGRCPICFTGRGVTRPFLFFNYRRLPFWGLTLKTKKRNLVARFNRDCS
jgi:hypothetical protein